MVGTLLRKVDVVWSGLPGTPYYSQFYFEHQPGNATPTAAALRTFLQALNANLANGLSSAIQTEQMIIDVVSGKAVSSENSAPQSPTLYTAASDPLPWTSQVLLRLSTSAFFDGRRLRGRIFMPGAVEAASVQGVLAAASQPTYNTPAAALITATSASGKWAVFSKRHQSWASVDTAVAWEQFAVLRKRRP